MLEGPGNMRISFAAPDTGSPLWRRGGVSPPWTDLLSIIFHEEVVEADLCCFAALICARSVSM
jgi:hypothetical protein